MLNADDLENVRKILNQSEDVLLRRKFVESCISSNHAQQLFDRLCSESKTNLQQMVKGLGDYELQALFLDLARKCNAIEEIGDASYSNRYLLNNINILGKRYCTYRHF